MSTGDLNLSVTTEGIIWQNPAEDPELNKVTLTGTFEAKNGKKYEITVTYNKQAIANKLTPSQLNNIDGEIQNSLGKIQTDILASLSNHTLRTNFTDLLEKKTFSVLDPDNQEIVDLNNRAQLSVAVRSIQNVFSKVFKIKKPKEEHEPNKSSELPPEFTELKGKLTSNECNNINAIGKIIREQYKTSSKEQEFYQALADRIRIEEEEGTGNPVCYIKSFNKTLSNPTLKDFLKEVHDYLLSKDSFISNIFIDSYLNKIVQYPSNKDAAYVPAELFRIQEGENRKISVRSPQERPKAFSGNAKEMFRILIPVNICNEHWILYSVDARHKKLVLTRYDSLPGFTKSYNEALNRLESKILDQMRDAFENENALAEIKEEKVKRQVNNNCGAHVVIKAESFTTNTEVKLKSKDYTSVRLDMLFSYLIPPQTPTVEPKKRS